MGTTESIPLDDNDDVSNGGMQASSGRSGGSSHQQQHRRHPRSNNLPSGSNSRPTHHPPITTAIRMSGMVLGMSQSGKQTLLARLEGKDPFSDQTLDDYSQRRVAVVPYKPPAGQRVWDRIQLQVQVSRSVVSMNSNNNNNNSNGKSKTRPVDFAVILINPSHDRTRIRDYLIETITDLLTLQGYGGDNSDDDDDDDDEQQQQDQQNNDGDKKEGSGRSRRRERRVGTTGRRTNPFCLCILLNFRDRMSPGVKWLEQADVRALTLDVLQDYQTNVSLEPDRLVLQCEHTSLYNCYGLDVLHHFIYQAYLQRKRTNLEMFLQQVHDARIESNRFVPSDSYDNFLVKIGQRQAPGDNSHPHPTTNQHQQQQIPVAGGPRRDDGRGSSHSKDHDDQISDSDRPSASTQRRRIIPTGQERQDTSRRRTGEENGHPGQRMPLDNNKPPKANNPVSQSTTGPPARSREALEAFLASDDESDVEEKPSQKDRRRDALEPDSGDDDDEFFYDETGFHGQHEYVIRTPTKKPSLSKIRLQENDPVTDQQEKASASIDENGEKKKVRPQQNSSTVSTNASTAVTRDESTSTATVPAKQHKQPTTDSDDDSSKNYNTGGSSAANGTTQVEKLSQQQQQQQEPSFESLDSSSSTLEVDFIENTERRDSDDIGTRGTPVVDDEGDSLDGDLPLEERVHMHSSRSSEDDEEEFFLGSSAELHLSSGSLSPYDREAGESERKAAEEAEAELEGDNNQHSTAYRMYVADEGSSSDEDDFVIDDPGLCSLKADNSPTAKTEDVVKSSPPAATIVPPAPSSESGGGGGLSAAALAAIQAAQKEAELMLHGNTAAGDSSPKKEKKKKKHKEDKKKKKKSKEKKSKVAEQSY